ncbi:MAG TPA: glycosyltransferase [Candidatus Binatia bacterium]|jgi:cellulose synthase/poly-beta-1,6-N-acetylglucosamine synthase-like glycosyltransferase|nr:glycosyltransferase [Candidatus Binatia bacterium]
MTEIATWTHLVFWSAVGVVIYTYLGYPAIVWLLGYLLPRPVHTAPVTPTITVLIAAYNEERRIADKIESCLNLAYPPEHLNIVIVSDGSTDRTVAIVESYVARYPDRVSLIALPSRRGKAHALNVGAAYASGEILLLADVRQRFDRLVARALARNFADAEVGAVSGELLLVEEGAGEGTPVTRG